MSAQNDDEISVPKSSEKTSGRNVLSEGIDSLDTEEEREARIRVGVG